MIFTTEDIANFYLEFEPELKQTTINWRVYTLVQMGVLCRIGRGRFSLGESITYVPELSSKIKSVYNKLRKEFPYLDICIWNTIILNQFMIHQPGRFFLIIEVDKEAIQAVFYFLKELKYPVFFELTNDILERYLPEDKEAVIIKPLVTEAPVQNVNGLNTITIEKLLVDIFCDDVIFSAQQGTEMMTIFNEAFKKYSINHSRMLRYANRRRKKESFQEYLSTIQIYGSNDKSAANL
jgi:rRNA maturation protein Rpf1